MTAASGPRQVPAQVVTSSTYPVWSSQNGLICQEVAVLEPKWMRNRTPKLALLSMALAVTGP